MKVDRNCGDAAYHVSDVYIVASTNTDIPNYYGKWLIERIDAGFVRLPLYRNPSEEVVVSLLPNDVRGLILYSKNYQPFFPFLDRLGAYDLRFFFTIGDHSVFRSRVPSHDQLVGQMEALLQRYGPDKVIWKIPPLFFGQDGRLRYNDNILPLAGRMRSVGVDKCMIEIFSSDFHRRDISGRLKLNRVEWVESDTETNRRSVAELMEQLETDYNIRAVDHTHELYPGMLISDIENRVEVFDIGRMGMACPTNCLYCDTNLTVNYDESGKRRRQWQIEPSDNSAGLRDYFQSLGMQVGNVQPERRSPYAVELRARVPVGDQGRPVLVDVIGHSDSRVRAYTE